LVNYIKIPTSISVFLLPAIALPFGLRLPGIVLLLVLARAGSALAYMVVCLRVFPVLRRAITFSLQPKIARPLVAYGGWVTVTNVVSPVLAYADRFLIGSMVSVSAIGYYAAPYEAVARLSVLYGSLVTALFPAFSSLRSAGDLDGLEHMYAKSIKFLLLIVGPVMLVLVFFARNLLLLWLGEDFALHSTFVFRLFAVGFFLTSLFVVPFTLLQGLGRADITAKFHVAELFFYVPLVWVLTMHWGLRGAAIAWTCRVIGDGVLLFGAAWRVFSFSPVLLIRRPCSRSILLLMGLGLPLYLVANLEITTLLRGVLTAGLAIAFYGGVWNYVLDPPEKGIIGSLVRYSATAPRESN
jgi:O-antigen/teichoic acid export membrane protein